MVAWPSRKGLSESLGDRAVSRDASRRRRRGVRARAGSDASASFVPSLESLEGRRVLASGVVFGGVLEITLASNDNATLLISGTDYKLDGNVVGTTVAGQPTTVSAGVSVFGSTGNETFNFKGGVALDQALDIDSAVEVTVIGQEINVVTPVTGLSIGSASITLNAPSITTTAAQVYSGAVTLSQGVTLSAGNGAITFSKTVNGPFDLTLNSAGLTKFGDKIGGTVALASITTDAPGTTAINGSAVTTSGPQSYGDTVTLGVAATTTLTGTNGSFAAVTGNSKALTLNFSGSETIDGATWTGLASLKTDAFGTTALKNGLTTTGDQVFGGPVVLTADTLLTTTSGGKVEFNGKVNGNFNLSVTSAGATTFLGAVGTTAGQALSSLTVDATGNLTLSGGTIKTSGNQTYNSQVTLGVDTTLIGITPTFAAGVTGAGKSLVLDFSGVTVIDGSSWSGIKDLTSRGGGTTTLLGTSLTTTGVQTYDDAVTLGANITLAAGASAISFNETVDGARALTVNTTGMTTFAKNVGGTTALTSLTTDASGGTTLGTAGAPTPTPMAVTTTAAQAYGDDITLNADTTLTGGTPTFANVDGVGSSLTLNFSGDTSIGAGFTNIRNLATGGGGTTRLSGSIATTGTQTYGDAVVLTANTTVAAGVNAITFNGTVDGNFGLTVNSAGATTFAGLVGDGTNLASLVTDANGTTAINGGVISTQGGGGQVYNDAVTIGAATILTAGANGPITFNKTLDSAAGSPFGLEAVTGGTTTFAGAVGATAPLASLTTDAGGSTTISAATVTTVGDQAYDDAVTLTNAANPIKLSAGGLLFGAGAIAAGKNLSISASTGAITSTVANIEAKVLTLLAQTGIDAKTKVTSLDASVLSAGSLSVNETDAITLGVTKAVSTLGGKISVEAGGAITLGQALDAGAGDVVLEATGGLIGFAGSSNVNATSLTVFNDPGLAVSGIELPLIAVSNLAVEQNDNGIVSIANSGNLTIGVGTVGIATLGETTITANNGAIDLLQPSTANGVKLSLIAPLGITQAVTGTISGAGGTLNASAGTGGGNIVLTNPTGNTISKLGGSTTGGNFAYFTAGAVSVGNIATQNGAVTLSSGPVAPITIGGTINALAGTVVITSTAGSNILAAVGGLITTTSGAGDITISTAAGGDIELPTITATGGDVTVTTQTKGDITLKNAVGAGGGNVVLRTANEGAIDSKTNNAPISTTGAGTITLQTVTAGSITTGIMTAGSGAIVLSTAGVGANVNTTAGSITTAGGSVTVTTGAAGAITLASVATAGGSQSFSTGLDGDFDSTAGTLSSNGGTITATASGTGGITSGPISSKGGAIRLDAGSLAATAILLKGDVSAFTTGRITLASGGGISDNGAAVVTASQLVVEAANGDVALQSVANDVASLALLNSSAGQNSIVSRARNLTVGVSGVATPGIQTANGNVSIDNEGFTIGATSTAEINLGNGVLTLEAAAISLASTAHQVASLAAATTGGGGIAFKAAGGLAIVSGVKASDGSVLDGVISGAKNAEIRLTAVGEVSQNPADFPAATVGAKGQLTISAGSVKLQNKGNEVDKLQVNTNGDVDYIDATNVSIGINGLAGAPAKAGSVSIGAVKGGIFQFAPVFASSLAAVATKGNVSLTDGANDVSSFTAESGPSPDDAGLPVGIKFADANDVSLGNLLADPTGGNGGFIRVTAGGSITVSGELQYDTDTPGSLVLQHGTGGSTDFVVKSYADAGSWTLRQRIDYLNDNAVLAPQDEKISFAINQFFPITILNQLPTIERKVTIGTDEVAEPDFRIAIDGTNAAPGTDGLTFGFGNAQGLGSNNSVIRGLNMYGFGGSAIVLHSSGNTVDNCWIGITRGSEAKANGVGIDIESTVGVGTTKLASSNTVSNSVISGNTDAGVRIRNQATLTTLTNNKIGTNAFGTVPIGNGGFGIDIDSSNLTTVGGLGVGNLIVNNALGGIRIAGALASGSVNLANKVLGNTIANNSFAGVTLEGALGNVIGGAGAGNTITDNSTVGISITNTRAVSLAAGNVVQANTISLNRVGGVVLENAAFQTVSGGNVITSNGDFAAQTGAGIEVRSSAAGNATDNVIAGNFIGTDASAAIDGGNAGQGILLSGASNTLVGSTSATDANVVAYNRTSGIQIRDDVGNAFAATANRIRGNTIRFNGVLGDPGFATGLAGVRIDGGSKNIVGGAVAGEGNLIADNKQAGVLVVNAASGSFEAGNRLAGNTIRTNELDGVALSGSTFQSIDSANVITANGRDGISLAGGSDDNRILGNRIGVDASNLAAGNERDGIRINGSTGTVIGSAAAASRNVIAANGTGAGGGSGISLVNGAFDTSIRNNLIGLDAAGVAAGNVGRGISVVGTGANQITGLVIGGVAANEGNVISANGLAGIGLEETDGAIIRGNRIGTDSTGTLAIGNLGHGVEIIGGQAGDVGGTVATAGNVISGNALSGVSVSDDAAGYSIRGNRIGTNAAGTAAVGNLQHGVAVADERTVVTIGGTALNTANTIAGNASDGVNVANGQATVLGNFIGTNSSSSTQLANGGDGIQVADGADTTVGDGTAQGRNVISGNAGRGLHLTGGTRTAVQGNYVGTNVAGTAALPNSLAGVRIEGATDAAIGTVNVISGNGGAGVELVGPATTAASIRGNFIGTNAAGTAAVANGAAGVSLVNAGGAGAANANEVGGLNAGDGNVIAGNASHGISITNSTNALVARNSIGLTVAGAPQANAGSGLAIVNSTAITATYRNQIAANGAYGVLVTGGSGNSIGADAGQVNKGLAFGNTITRNKLDGIRIEGGSTGNIVAANTIGAVSQGNGGRGITIAASNDNTIGGIDYGNVVGSNAGDGIGIVDAVAAGLGTGNRVLGNQVRSNLGRGIVVDNSDFQSIGGLGAGEGNTVVLNSSHGVDLRNDADGNLVAGNFIGTSASFAGGLGNLASGIRVFGGLSQANAIESNRVQGNAQSGILLDGAVANTVGGVNAGNTVVSQGGAGISIVGGASLNTVTGNLVGTDKAGLGGANLGNKADGVSIVSSVGNTIGGTVANDGNTVRFNQVGVSMTGAAAASLASGNVVLGNTIDQNLREGVRLFASSFNTVGDANGLANNTVTRNAGDGIAVLTGSASNLLRGNTVGGATTANGNRGAGIRVAGSTLNTLAANTVQSNLGSGVVVSGASKTLIGGTAPADANMIASNVGDGILLADNASLSTVQSNTVASNTGNGISIQRSVGNAIGTATAGNTVQKNTLDGILVSSLSANTAVQGNTVGGAGNANAGNGIRVVGALGTLVGGTTAGTGNTVGLNSRSGVAIEGVTSRTAAAATKVYGNTISDITAAAAISVSASLGQVIGGTDPGEANTITGSKVGVQLLAGTTGSVVAGNSINGSTTSGVTITASVGNTISGNTITKSQGDGIRVSQAAAATIAGGNRIVANLIGTDANSATDLGNTGAGIRLSAGTTFTTIGTAGQGNTIGNNAIGIAIEGGSNANVIEANFVGTDAGDVNIRNTGAGIQITASLSNVVRGGNTVARNQTGIRIVDAVAPTTAVGNRIEGNTIRDNTVHGVRITGGGRHTVGGTAAGSANTIVVNGGNGIDIISGSSGNLVRGNFIGTDAVGTDGLGNAGSGVSISGGNLNEVAFGNVIKGNTKDGVAITGASSTTIGGSAIATGNTISMNTGNGVSLANGSSNNLVAANTISGNMQAGVMVSGASSQGNVIGVRAVAGAPAGLGNTISGNKGGGVVVDAAVRNQVFANLISGNTAVGGTLVGRAAGIRLLNSGNASTPSPTILTAAVAGRQLTLTGTVGSIAGRQFWIEVYRNGTSGTSQANEPIGRVLVTTRTGGSYTAAFTLANGTFLPSGEWLTATATTSVGNTSAISARTALA
jgi:parallel beta-helix repeat protein